VRLCAWGVSLGAPLPAEGTAGGDLHGGSAAVAEDARTHGEETDAAMTSVRVTVDPKDADGKLGKKGHGKAGGKVGAAAGRKGASRSVQIGLGGGVIENIEHDVTSG